MGFILELPAVLQQGEKDVLADILGILPGQRVGQAQPQDRVRVGLHEAPRLLRAVPFRHTLDLLSH